MEAGILRALAKDPADRYPSARAMLDDLEAGPAAEVVPETVGISRRAIRRRSRVASFAVPAVIVVLAVAALWLGAAGLGYVDVPALRGGQENSLNRAGQVESNAIDAPASGVRAAAPANADAEMVPVPNVNTYFDYWAEQTLADNGFKVKVVYGYRNGYANRGVTWATEPAMGTLAPEGSTVTVYATPKDLYQPQL
jgi:serine/threonine-protein kinase